MEIKRKETKKKKKTQPHTDYLKFGLFWEILADWGIKKSGELLSKTPFSESHCFSTFMALTGDRQKPEAKGVQRWRDNDDFLKI